MVQTGFIYTEARIIQQVYKQPSNQATPRHDGDGKKNVK